jgi:hypothetical protein
MAHFSLEPANAFGTGWRHRRAGLARRILAVVPVGLLFVLTGCGSVTLFQSSFNSAVGAPPTTAQATGTVAVSGATGSVVVTSPPPNATGNWVKISRANSQGAPISNLTCNLSQPPQNGSYSFLSVLFIPKGSGLATLEFDTGPSAGPPLAGFLHLDFGDFSQPNTVRLNDDNSQLFGTFPRDQFFTVAVNLNIGSSTATATINLYGSGASGTKDVNIVNGVTPLSLPQQFGAVKFFMGYPWSGSFDASDILVTRKR